LPCQFFACQFFKGLSSRLAPSLALAIAIALGTVPLAQAQVLRPEVRFPFLADPLLDDPRDPLLPNPPVPRPLSPLELYALEQDLDQLALEAAALDRAGDLEEARLAWRREVRLRRLLGVEQELAAIDRAGQVLRDRTATQDLQLYAVRLDEIRADLTLPEDSEFIEAMAATYVVLGDVGAASEIHRALADGALAAGDRTEQYRQLETLATLQADWFYFPEAAQVYGELVALAQAEGDRDDELGFLQLQADNLEQAQDLEGAIALHQQLLTRYQADESLWPQIPPLQHQIASNYRTLGDLDTAVRQYQIAYTNAIDQGQLEVAANAITDLAEIYKTLDRWADVGYLAEQLLLVAQQGHNAFAMMMAYDQLGQVHEQLGATPSALAAYREGLVLARVLGTGQDYFEAQITRLTEGAP
jgi:tetratricopeptide (TPR) repeat protein